jgi:hypothetical protein
MKLLLFAGAGTSMELGVPGMIGMGEEFLDHAKQWDIEPDLVQKIMGDSLDVEHLIEALDRIYTARRSLETIGQDTIPLERVNKIRAEVEWFVQHAAERVVGKDAQLMWGSVLRATTSVNITLLTTNYDRAIELASNAEQVRLDDGFGQFDQGETATWVGFDQNTSQPRLVKLHGSTDWYAEGQLATPTKLRHPMPLFGRAALHLASGQKLGSALVLPSREKLLTHDPYPRLSQTFLNAADSCDMAIFVGSSLRDHHILSAAKTTADRVPVFIVNPDGDVYGIENAHPFKQFASTFLIATLPNALISPDPIAALKTSVIVDPNENKGILVALRQALDTDAPADLRCRALEELDDMEVTLDAYLLRQLIADADPKIARYSLGLLSLSAVRDTLIEEIDVLPNANDNAFSDDLQLLRDMVKKQSN